MTARQLDNPECHTYQVCGSPLKASLISDILVAALSECNAIWVLLGPGLMVFRYLSPSTPANLPIVSRLLMGYLVPVQDMVGNWLKIL